MSMKFKCNLIPSALLTYMPLGTGKIFVFAGIYPKSLSLTRVNASKLIIFIII